MDREYSAAFISEIAAIAAATSRCGVDVAKIANEIYDRSPGLYQAEREAKVLRMVRCIDSVAKLGAAADDAMVLLTDPKRLIEVNNRQTELLQKLLSFGTTAR